MVEQTQIGVIVNRILIYKIQTVLQRDLADVHLLRLDYNNLLISPLLVENKNQTQKTSQETRISNHWALNILYKIILQFC